MMESSQLFMLYLALMAFLGSCIGLTFQFVLKSRCETIRCFGIHISRNVLPASQAELEIPETMVRPVIN